MKFSLTTLIILVAYCAFAFMTLANPSEFWKSFMPLVRGVVLSVAVIAVFHSTGVTRSVFLTFAVFGLMFSSVVDLPYEASNLVAEVLSMPEYGVVSDKVYYASQTILDEHLVLGGSLLVSLIGVPIFLQMERKKAKANAASK
ncbi:MAG: hypothetical protein AAFU85_27335 [Planctomycetota bacterium]